MTVVATTELRTRAFPLWAAVALGLLYGAAVCTEPGQRLDQAAMIWLSGAVRDHRSAVLLLGQVSATTVVAASAALGMITAAVRGPARALIGVLTAGGILVVAEVLKLVLNRPNFLEDGVGNSFPSGHVATVAGLATALLIAVPPATRRVVGWLAVAPVVALIGLATVILQWHRPSDVLGSILLAALLGGPATRLADHPYVPWCDRFPTRSRPLDVTGLSRG